MRVMLLSTACLPPPCLPACPCLPGPQIVQRAQASPFCQEQLRRIEVERSDDVRLDRHLFRACSADIRAFCKDVEPGGWAEVVILTLVILAGFRLCWCEWAGSASNPGFEH